ncbi:hypothetical protein [Rubinisphaera margarita]|uniref:hypothetical protein n=1 Tax=Rubinisphaera margarita TaxID=2909586 RepID=UPI001EE8ECEE|nr:hypothetical protein [Rubinisphaera margarita]MCG6157670.1 hypothetical protein [Rubinisphaera margarita]
MRCCFCALLSSLLLTTIIFAADQPGRPAAKPKPFTISEKTTRLLGPIHPEGYVDYVAVLNEEAGENVAPDQNAAIPICALTARSGISSFGPVEWDWKEVATRLNLEDHLLEHSKSRFYRLHELAGFPSSVDKKDRILREIIDAGSRPWTPESSPWAARYIDANHPALPSIREALQRPHYFNPLMEDVVPTRNFRGALLVDLGSWLETLAFRQLDEGNLDEASETTVLLFRLATHLRNSVTYHEARFGSIFHLDAARLSLVLIFAREASPEFIRKFRQQLKPFAKPVDVAKLFDRWARYRCLQFVQLRALRALDDNRRLLLGIPLREDKMFGTMDGADWDLALEQINLVFDAGVKAWENVPGPELLHSLLEMHSQHYSRTDVESTAATMSELSQRRSSPFSDLPERKGRFFGELIAKDVIYSMHCEWDFGFTALQYLELVQIAAVIRLQQLEHQTLPASSEELRRSCPEIPELSLWGEPFTYKTDGREFLLEVSRPAAIPVADGKPFWPENLEAVKIGLDISEFFD